MNIVNNFDVDEINGKTEQSSIPNGIHLIGLNRCVIVTAKRQFFQMSFSLGVLTVITILNVIKSIETVLKLSAFGTDNIFPD